MLVSTRSRAAAAVLATALICGAGSAPALAAQSSSLPAVAAAAATTVGERLEVGGTLRAGEQLESSNGANGVSRFVMQTDGNAVVYNAVGAPIWVSGTTGAGNSLTLQRDGNVVIYSAQGAALWASGSAGRGEPAFLVVQTDGNLVSYAASGAALWSTRGEDTLQDGRQLERGQALVSADGRYRAVYQTDGNLVVYGPAGPRWSAGTSSGSRLALEAGGLASFAGPGAVWHTGTFGRNEARLVLQVDGNLVIYSSSAEAVWSSDGGSPTYRNSLLAGDQLSAGQLLRSLGGDMQAVMQGDGNFVVYYRDFSGDLALWSTGTSGAGNRLVMQSDGNAVVYSVAGRALWSSSTGGNPGAQLVLQNNANLVVFGPGASSAGGRAIWDWQPDGYVVPSGA